MIRRSVAATLCLLLCSMVGAQTPTDKHARFTQKVKDAVIGLGTGRQAKLRVHLRNRTRLKGFVRTAGEESFELVSEKGLAVSIPYRQVKHLKGRGVSLGNSITGLEAAMIGGLVATLAFALIMFKVDGPK